MSRITCHYCDNPAKWRCDYPDCNAPVCNAHRHAGYEGDRNLDLCYYPHNAGDDCCSCRWLPKAPNRCADARDLATP